MEAENVDGTGPGNALARETPPRMRTHPPRFSMRSVAVALALLGSIGAVLLVSAPTVSATTYVRGVYTTDVTWGVADTLYIATGAVTIRAPWTLTIMPGTTVRFDPGVHLFVDGQLKADGTLAKPITFAANTSSLTPWGGIQFNASSSGSVSWSTFDRVDRAISATDSSPDIISNKIIQAGAGFVFLRSSSYVSSNTILRATNVGVYANASSVQISNNAINNTAIGIQVEQPGFPTVSGNRITNVSSGFAMGILVTGGATASIDGNTVQGVRGSPGLAGIGPGAPGRDGTIGVGIYVSGAPSASLTSNAVESVSGGRGGDGQANTGGTGGRGGNGGSAAGIVVVGTTNPMIQCNTVTTMTGGNGGSGGGSATTTTGGRGGDAGTAVAIEVVNSIGTSQLFTNTADGVSGGGRGRRPRPARRVRRQRDRSHLLREQRRRIQQHPGQFQPSGYRHRRSRGRRHAVRRQRGRGRGDRGRVHVSELLVELGYYDARRPGRGLAYRDERWPRRGCVRRHTGTRP